MIFKPVIFGLNISEFFFIAKQYFTVWIYLWTYNDTHHQLLDI